MRNGLNELAGLLIVKMVDSNKIVAKLRNMCSYQNLRFQCFNLDVLKLLLYYFRPALDFLSADIGSFF